MSQLKCFFLIWIVDQTFCLKQNIVCLLFWRGIWFVGWVWSFGVAFLLFLSIQLDPVSFPVDRGSVRFGVRTGNSQFLSICWRRFWLWIRSSGNYFDFWEAEKSNGDLAEWTRESCCSSHTNQRPVARPRCAPSRQSPAKAQRPKREKSKVSKWRFGDQKDH